MEWFVCKQQSSDPNTNTTRMCANLFVTLVQIKSPQMIRENARAWIWQITKEQMCHVSATRFREWNYCWLNDLFSKQWPNLWRIPNKPLWDLLLFALCVSFTFAMCGKFNQDYLFINTFLIPQCYYNSNRCLNSRYVSVSRHQAKI